MRKLRDFLGERFPADMALFDSVAPQDVLVAVYNADGG